MSAPAHLRQNMTRGVWQIWPQAIIPYALEDGFDDSDRAMIANAMAYIEEVSKKAVIT